MQAMIYLVIGITIAFILTSTLIFSVCHCIKSGSSHRKNDGGKLVSSQDNSESERKATFQRHSYLQQSPMTEETISLEDFDQQHRR